MREDVQQESIYRKEALEHRTRATVYGDPLVSAPRWVAAGFWILLAAVAAVATFAARASVQDTTVAPALVDLSNGVAGADLPSGIAQRLEPGTPVRIDLADGETSIRARVTRAGADAAESAGVLEQWERVMPGEPDLLTLEVGPAPAERAGDVVGGQLVVPVEENVLDLLVPDRDGAFRG